MSTIFDATQMFSGPTTPTFVGYGRNRFINGQMSIDQPNGGGAYTVNSPSSAKLFDMFDAAGQTSDGVFTVQRQSAGAPTGFANYMRITVTTPDASVGATQYYWVDTRVEGFNISDFGFGTAGAKTFTISFWARCNITGTFGGLVSNNVDRTYGYTYTINNTNTWEYKSVVIPGETSGAWSLFAGNGLTHYFDVGTGANGQIPSGSWNTTISSIYAPSGTTKLISTNGATLDITGLQLEIGLAATPFENRPYPLELQLCQRYYEKSYGRDTNPGTATGSGAHAAPGAVTNSALTVTRFAPVFFKVSKRTIPTVSIWDAAGVSGHLFTTNSSDVNTSRIGDIATPSEYEFTVRSTQGTDLYCGSVQWVADARL